MHQFKIVCWAAVLLFSGNLFGQTIQLKTENYPPFNMDDGSGSIIGVSTEIVKRLFRRANVKYEMELLPWQRAYKLALENEDHAVFSTTRTAERENLFKWVGPINPNNWVFLKKEEKEFKISSLEDAKRYRVGGYSGDAVALFLEGQGFEIDYVSKDYLNAKKLDHERIDLWATGQLLGPYYAKENDVHCLEEAFVFKETIMSIAFNKDTDDALIDKLNSELALMAKEGVIEQIRSKFR